MSNCGLGWALCPQKPPEGLFLLDLFFVFFFDVFLFVWLLLALGFLASVGFLFFGLMAFGFYGLFGFYWFLVSIDSVGFVASIGFWLLLAFWLLLTSWLPLAFGFCCFCWLLVSVGFAFYGHFDSVGYSTYRRVTLNYIELLALGLRWLKVTFAFSSCCCCCVAGGGGGGGSSRAACVWGRRCALPPTPSSFEISMTFFGFVFVVASSCLL